MCPAGDAQRLVIERRAPSVHRDASPDLVDDHRLLPALSTTGNDSHCWSRDKAPPPTPLRDPASGKRRPRPRAELDKVDRRPGQCIINGDQVQAAIAYRGIEGIAQAVGHQRFLAARDWPPPDRGRRKRGFA
jgi:hypothetical protein